LNDGKEAPNICSNYGTTSSIVFVAFDCNTCIHHVRLPNIRCLEVNLIKMYLLNVGSYKMQQEYIDNVGISLEAPCNDIFSNKSGIHIAIHW